MKKLSFFLMAMLFSVMSFAAEETATLSFANKEQRTLQNTNQQVWTQNGITLTNDKASSTSAVADYVNPARFYKSSKITVKCDLGTITKIVFDCNSSSYATALKSSITSGTVTVSSDKVTVVPATESDTYVINSLTGGQVRMDALTVTYVAEEEDPNTPVYTITATSADATMGSITGAGEYKQGKEVSLTAVANPGYEFVKWSNESTENPLVFEATENVTLTATFQAQTPITIAEANQLKDNATGILKEFVVTYVYKSYIHIQDETGYAMAYKYDYGLKAGDKVTGFTFSKTTYNGLAQLVPTTTKLADLGIVSGEAPAVPEVTTAPTGNYQTVVKLMNVKMTGSFTTSSNTTLVATCPDETTINVYNNKNLTYTFADGKTYNIVGGITQFSNTIQVLAYAIEEYVAPTMYNVTVTAENGTVAGAGEYEEGKEATLTATANEGYEFTCWTSGEDTVSTANPYTFAVTANVALVANFKEVVVEEPVEAKLYLTPNANWKQSNARFAAYFFDNGETWVGMTKVAGETDLYEVTIPTDKKYPKVIFCRMNPSAAANNWNNKWNQTANLVIPTDGKNHYTVKDGTWDNGGGTWSIWPVPTVKTYVDITITVTANAPASIKWTNAGDKLADATEYVAMTAGENNTYTYTLAQVDELKGVDYTVKVGEAVSATQNTSKNVTVDFKALLPQVAVQGVNNWDGTDKMTIADDYLTASITLPLVAKKYDLKLTLDATWKGTTSNKITRENNSSAFTGDSGNGSITADIAGDYVFTYTYATQTLTVTYPELVTTITATFDLTQEKDTRNMGGTYNIYAGDYTLRIYGYNGAGTYQDDPTTEEDAAPMLFTPDYEDPLDAVVVVTIDEENNKEVMQVTATSADGKKIYNLTINIALPSYETFNFVATGVTAVPETEDGFTMYALEGEFDYEGTPVPFEFYATTEPASVMGTIGEAFVLGEGENVAFFIEADNSFYLRAILKDEQGNIYNIEMMGTVAASQEVEIVVAKEENITLYNLNLNVQGNMAMVSAGNDALSFWLTLLPTENYYGGYMNDAFSNIWYGEDPLYAAYGDMHLYGDNNGQVMFVVSFITKPDAEGNVTKYNFTLYPGDKPVDSKHTVTITVNPEGAGTVTGAGEYEDGAEVTVTAEANEGYIFLGWMEDGEFVANDSKYTFTILNDVDLVAVYATQLFGVAEDLVITETALTATAILSTGTKLTVNLVLGEYDEEEKGYWLAETTTLTLGDKELTFLEGLVMVDTEQQTAMAAVLAENEGVIYAFTLVLKAPASGVDNINTNVAPRKVIRDGQLIIIKNGVEYNVQGAQL